jgi:hypothetical protein
LYKESDFHQIISHERIHYEQGHSWDLLFFELMRILFWVNPAIYLMTRSIRTTHEYLADRSIIKKGFNEQNYQLLILNHIRSIPCPAVTNTFNYSQAKRRILMLNSEKSSVSSRMKTIIIVPILLALIILINVPSEAIDVPVLMETEPMFELPLQAGKITQKFEMAVNPYTKKEVFHKGIDIAAKQGSEIYASEDGMVILADSLKGHGNKIILQHHNGYTTHYSHLFKILVSNQEKVKTGSIIGLVGSTGLSTAPHLHFEIRKDNKAINPADFLDLSTFESN